MLPLLAEGIMAFEIVGSRSSVVVGDDDEKIISDLPRTLGLQTPQCDRLWEAFYRSPRLSSVEEVGAFRTEVAAISSAYQSKRRHVLVKERNIHSKDPSVVERIVGPMLAADPAVAKCQEIISLCDEAIAVGAGLSCSSD
jgi:hypothetical protein